MLLSSIAHTYPAVLPIYISGLSSILYLFDQTDSLFHSFKPFFGFRCILNHIHPVSLSTPAPNGTLLVDAMGTLLVESSISNRSCFSHRFALTAATLYMFSSTAYSSNGAG